MRSYVDIDCIDKAFILFNKLKMVKEQEDAHDIP